MVIRWLTNICIVVDCKPQYNWMHHVVLDAENKFHVKWLFEKKNEIIIFQVCVETHGWFGLGISQSGGMAGSDIVIGWVDSSGFVHLQVC